MSFKQYGSEREYHLDDLDELIKALYQEIFKSRFKIMEAALYNRTFSERFKANYNSALLFIKAIFTNFVDKSASARKSARNLFEICTLIDPKAL